MIQPTIHELLHSVPDWTELFTSPQSTGETPWILTGRQAIQRLKASNLNPSNTISLEWSQILESYALNSTESKNFGFYSSIQWRKFVLSTFFTDLVSYLNPIDQVTFDRLLFIMHRFPQGFRVWWTQVDGLSKQETWWPVGYSGWYPIAESCFELLNKLPQTVPQRIRERTIIPEVDPLQPRPYLYLFNYSVAPALRKSYLSKMLMARFSQDIVAQNAQGLSCITVSEDGAQVATRFGMKCSGTYKIQDSIESVYTKKA